VPPAETRAGRAAVHRRAAPPPPPPPPRARRLIRPAVCLRCRSRCPSVAHTCPCPRCTRNHGRTYFFQNEHPYDVPTQSAWRHGDTNGFAAYKVGDHVTEHHAWGLGSYAFFNLNADIYTDRAYEVPDTPGVVFTSLMTVCINGPGGGGILRCINDAGDPVVNGFGTYYMKSYSNGVATV
jgi:hypothetical protein